MEKDFMIKLGIKQHNKIPHHKTGLDFSKCIIFFISRCLDHVTENNLTEI